MISLVMGSDNMDGLAEFSSVVAYGRSNGDRCMCASAGLCRCQSPPEPFRFPSEPSRLCTRSTAIPPADASQRALARFARHFAHQLRHKIPRKSCTQRAQQFVRPDVAHLEMRRAAHTIELVQVVRQHAEREQAFGKLDEC